MSSRLPREQGGLHTPRSLQEGADQAGRGEQGSSTYLCSSSSSSLVIIDLYWFPRSFPGLYLKENASSAAGEGGKGEKGDGVRQKAPESDHRHPGAGSLQLLTPAATHTPGCPTTGDSCCQLQSLQKTWAVPGIAAERRDFAILSELPALGADTEIPQHGKRVLRSACAQSPADPSWLIQTR